MSGDHRRRARRSFRAKGVRYNITLERLYKDGNDWRYTSHFNRDDLLLARVDGVTCQQDDLPAPQQLPSTLSYALDPEAFRAIDQLAFQTYAPATEESRAGAGAGLTDND